MYEKPQVNATYTFTRDLPYTLPVIYLRAYARKNYATMKIHLKRNRAEINVFFFANRSTVQYGFCASVRAIQCSVAYEQAVRRPRRACSQAKYSQERILS